MEWISVKDTKISNKFIYGEYIIRYEDTIYGYQYIIYRNDKMVASCQTLIGAKEKVEKMFDAE